jgi:excisionase family DNA binding protein
MNNEIREPQQTTRLLHPIVEAADLLGIGRTSLYHLIRSGDLKPVRLSGRTLIPHDQLVELVARRVAEES